MRIAFVIGFLVLCIAVGIGAIVGALYEMIVL